MADDAGDVLLASVIVEQTKRSPIASVVARRRESSVFLDVLCSMDSWSPPTSTGRLRGAQA
jgi:hypothetical protein